MLSKNETLSRGQLWHELNWNTSFEIFSNLNFLSCKLYDFIDARSDDFAFHQTSLAFVLTVFM